MVHLLPAVLLSVKVKVAYKNSILEAQRLLRSTDDVGHDFGHGQRVVKNARLIGTKIGFSDLDLLEVCGWWHDVGRLYNPNHEKLSAKLMSRDLKRRGVDYKTRRRAYKAVYKHRWDMKPKTLQGCVIKDADKLDFISVERWRQRERAGDRTHNQKILGMLPQVRQNLYFDISRQLFDKRLEEFAENLEHSGSWVIRTLVAPQPA